MATVVSYGGGVQSTALVVLATTGVIGDVDLALFANVGDDSEHPATLAYVREFATPWAAEHGLEIVEVRRKPTSTKRIDLRATMMLHPNNSLNEPIPVYGTNGAPMSRSCTQDWKIGAMHRWLKEHELLPVTSMIGISTDEVQRAGRGKDDDGFTRRYPLLELGLNRSACKQVIREAGLPVPPKSACFFCPFHKPLFWRELRRDEPELFDQAQELEDVLNGRRSAKGSEPVFLTRFGKRLSEAVTEAQPSLFDAADLDNPTSIGDEGCDEGVCFV